MELRVRVKILFMWLAVVVSVSITTYFKLPMALAVLIGALSGFAFNVGADYFCDYLMRRNNEH